MDINHTDGYSYLDSVRYKNGTEMCKAEFKDIYKSRGSRAVAMLNDKRLSFACLYLLIPQLEALRLIKYLNYRNLMAIRIVKQIIKPRSGNNGIDYLAVKRNSVYSVLKWMLETGNEMDCYDDDYEEIMDIIVSVLLVTYKDESIFPIVADMIFKRDKTGHLIHDLVWAFFKTENPEALKHIAMRLKSPDKAEAKLARELLSTEDNDFSQIENASGEVQYQNYLKWLGDNDPFLYFTEEGYNIKSSPAFSAVDTERKYLNKALEAHSIKSAKPLDDEDMKCLEVFRTLENTDKAILSEYSHKIHDRDISEWENWIKAPVSEQLKIARKNREGYV